MTDSSTTPSPSTTVLGLGGCLDYETVWDAEVLSALAAEHGIGSSDLDHGSVISSVPALVGSILAFIRDGSGGERAVADAQVVEAVASRFDSRVTLGGSSVRAAIAMSRVGVPSTLHLVSEDPQVRGLLPEDVRYVCSATADAVNPHLIIQFPAGASVTLADGTAVVAPRENRLIYVADPANTAMELSPDLPALLRDAQIFFISGFNAMADAEALHEHMDTLVEAMAALPAHALVVFEDAGYHVPGFEHVVIDALSDRIDVYGMNEDELQAHVGRRVDLLDPDSVALAIREVRPLVRAPILVIHTQHWALAHGAGAVWMRDVLAGGIDMASTRFLHGDALDASRYAITGALPRQEPAVEFADRIEQLLADEVVCVPARQLSTSRATTIGLGDAFVGGMLAVMARAAQREPAL